MKNPKHIIQLILAFVLPLTSVAQDINFSQFYDIPMLRNPALAGIFTGDFRFTSAYRNQWQSVTVPYRTVGLGVEVKKSVGFGDDFVTFGVQATNDVAGDSRLSRTQVFPVINYHKSLGGEQDSYLSAGIMAGPVMQQFDPSKLSFDDQFQHGAYSASNPTAQTFTNTRSTYWDPAVGLMFSSTAGENTTYYIGAGVFHFTRPKVAFQQDNNIVLNPKYALNLGLAKPTSNENMLIAYADVFMQGGATMAQGGLMLMHDLVQFDDEQKVSIGGGMFYRLRDALIPVVRLDYRSWGIGMTYDINTSKLRTASQYRGGFEMTLSYKGALNKHNSAADKVRCPHFY